MLRLVSEDTILETVPDYPLGLLDCIPWTNGDYRQCAFVHVPCCTDDEVSQDTPRPTSTTRMRSGGGPMIAIPFATPFEIYAFLLTSRRKTWIVWCLPSWIHYEPISSRGCLWVPFFWPWPTLTSGDGHRIYLSTRRGTTTVRLLDLPL